ncbi:MAG TPA: aminoglycoside phosphotransferase family protein [Gammaproteobacteria bacterium]|nr:aminoglycoside phosphotransferase family protein [Gammaproteobacteria bacterium]
MKFLENMINMYGEQGKTWLASLPEITANLSAAWNLRDLKEHDNLSFNYVLDGLQNNRPVILKIGIDQASVKNEVAALSAFQGYGMVELLATDLEHSAMLLERLIPGKTLTTLIPAQDSTALKIACNVIDRLHQAPIPANNKFPTLAHLLQVLDQDWDLPQQYLSTARSLRDTLLKDTSHDVLLHGDLHFDNILSNADSWAVIDPKGVIGNATYDKIGCLLREPLAKLLQVADLRALLTARMQTIAQHFGLEPKVILDWTYMHTVMAICWCIEDKQDPGKMLEFLQIIAAMRT